MMNMSEAMEATISKINWIKPYKAVSDKDVSIRETGGTERTATSYQITLRNQTGLKFDSAIQIGFYRNRIYFRNEANGYHVNVQARDNNRYHGYIKMKKNKNTEFLSSFVGDYDLKESDMPGFYYVEMETIRG